MGRVDLCDGTERVECSAHPAADLRVAELLRQLEQARWILGLVCYQLLLTLDGLDHVIEGGHHIRLRHLLDRLEDQHDVVAEGLDVLLAEPGDDAVDHVHPALGEREVPLLVEAHETIGRNIHGVLGERCHVGEELAEHLQVAKTLIEDRSDPDQAPQHVAKVGDAHIGAEFLQLSLDHLQHVARNRHHICLQLAPHLSAALCLQRFLGEKGNLLSQCVDLGFEVFDSGRGGGRHFKSSRILPAIDISAGMGMALPSSSTFQ